MLIRVILAVVSALWACTAHAEIVSIAVTGNFTNAMQRLAPKFETSTGHKLLVIYGTTDKLYLHAINGASIDVFLSADDEHPLLLEQRGTAVPHTRFTYAIGRLVLWSPESGYVDAHGDILRRGNYSHLAIANPKTTAYGPATEQTLRRLGLWNQISSRMIYGDSIAQAFQFVSTGNAQLGIVSLAQVRTLITGKTGSYWIIPQRCYDPLRHDAVLLKQAANKQSAQLFLDFLRSPYAQTVIRELGYETPET